MLTLLVFGAMTGWTSPYIAQLTAADSPLPITLDEASWVASLMTLGRLVGAVPGAVCMNYIGSRMTLIMIGLPMAISWVCMIVASSVEWLYASRFISGLGMGMAYSSFPFFLGEIASAEIRGTLVSFAISGLAIGTLTGNAMGANVSMSVFAYICLIPTVIVILTFAWLPESPHHLIRKGRMKDAKISVVRYNPGANAEVEVRALEDFINATDSIRLVDKLREFNIPANRKAGIIVILLFMFMQFSGINIVVFYMETILTNGGWTITLPSTMVIVSSSCAILTGFLAVYLADRYGRKALTIVSSAGASVSMLGLGTHFALLENGFDPSNLQLLLISSLLGFGFFFLIGLCTVPSMMTSELFAPNIKSIASCFGSISIGLFSFIATKTYQPLLNLVGPVYVFVIYAGLMMLSILFAVTIMPETKGKSLQEIQNILHKKYVAVVRHDYENGNN